MAADIESLIRQALARQNGFDPEVRLRIYQSSRNALAKMIARSGVVPPDVIESRNRALEYTISKIEREFTAEMTPASNPPVAEVDLQSAAQVPGEQSPAPQVSIPPSFEPTPAPGARQSVDAERKPAPVPVAAPVAAPAAVNEIHSHQAAHPAAVPLVDNGRSTAQPAPTSPTPTPVSVDNSVQPVSGSQQQYAEPTPQYVRPHRKPIRYIIWIIAIAIIAIAGWVAYMVTIEFLGPQQSKPLNGQISQNGTETDAGSFVTILEPGQPGALVTAGNGTAEILSDTSQPAIRIMSVRQPDARETQAEPLLLELAPGILKDIAGKKVTVEILAKSGDTGPATFAVVCDFGELGDCGRKRFRIGLQPEAVIFSIQISADYKEGQRAFLAINTDVTSAAALSGKGARIDIIYARIRPSNGN